MAILESADVELEPLDGVRVVWPLLRERRYLGREVVHERGLDQIVLVEPLEYLGGDLSRTIRRLHIDAELSCQRRRGVAAAKVGVSDGRPEPGACRRTRAFAQRHAAIGRRERNLVLAESDEVAAGRLAGTGRQHLLGHDHQFLIVRVGLVELEHRELRIVLRRDPLVPEVAVDLVHALEPAHDEPLQIELRRDPQKELHVERVVVRDERTRQRAARDRLHHRSFDFEVAAGVQEAADRGEHLTAHLENPPGVRVHDQVEVTLPVPDFHVAQSVPLLGQRHEALDEELEARSKYRELVRPGPEQLAPDADEVPEIEQLEDREVALGERVLADIDLDPRSPVGNDQEVGLAKTSNRNHPPRRRRLHGRRFESFRRGATVGSNELVHRMGARKRTRIGIDTKAHELLEVGTALEQLVGFAVFFGHMLLTNLHGGDGGHGQIPPRRREDTEKTHGERVCD